MENNQEQRLEELSKYIDVCGKVTETVNTDGWKEVLQPMLDKMIIDVIGGKENGRWSQGSISKHDIGSEPAIALLSYKRALTDFSNYILQYVDGLEVAKAEYTEVMREKIELEKYESEYEEKKDDA